MFVVSPYSQLNRKKKGVETCFFFDFNISDFFDITEKLNTISIFHIITDVAY